MCVEQHVHTLRLPVARRADWEAWFLLMSDVHWDNPECRRDLLARHLDQARERGARVFVIGDLFCLMNGKFDPRRSLGKVRPEHKVDNYLDAVIDDAVAWWSPWADLVELVTPGNHESAVMNTTGTDPTARFCKGIGCAAGTFQGWVRVKVEEPADGKGWASSLLIRYHHGHGGGGVVTKGTLWPIRRAAVLPDADVFISGHIHEQWSFPITRERLLASGRVVQDTQLHLCLPTYKPEAIMGSGWAVEKGMSPRPLGAWWLRVGYDAHEKRLSLVESRAA